MSTILLLSSTKFLKEHPTLEEYIGKPLQDMKFAYVINASKGEGNVAYMDRAKKIFAENKYNYETLDLDGKDSSYLEKYMTDFEAVYMQGGNTYRLLKSIRESGFEEVLKKRIADGLVYIGASAGAYVASPTIEMMTWKRSSIDKYDRYGVVELTAMNLVPFLTSAHFEPEYADELKSNIKKTAFPVKVLNDKQAILVKDGKAELVGEGVEIIL